MAAVRKYSGELGLVALYLLSLIPYWRFKVDDAYIAFVYAKNLVSGSGLTYNGTVVEGYSSLLWTLLMAPFIRFGVDPLLAARVLSVICGIVAILVVFQLARRLSHASKVSAPLLGTASVAVLSPLLAWTTGGMETLLLAMWIALLVWNEWEPQPRWRWLTPTLLLLAALTRPEAVLLFPCWLAARLLRAGGKDRFPVLEIFPFIVAYGAFLAWRLLTYGYPLPNTAYVKLGPGPETFRLAAQWLAAFFVLRPLAAALLLAGVAIELRQRPFGHNPLLLTFLILIGFASFILFAGRDWMPHHRFLAPVVPLLGLIATRALDAFSRRRLRLAMVALATLAVAFESRLSLTIYRDVGDEMGRFVEGLKRGGEWIRATTPSTAEIAVVDAGTLAYFSERKTWDMLGLNDEHIAHSPDGMDLGYVLSREPDLIQLHVAFDSNGRLAAPTDHPLNRRLLAHPQFISCYAPDTRRLDDPYFPYLFVRVCR
jgi:hypothetical protein